MLLLELAATVVKHLGSCLAERIVLLAKILIIVMAVA